MRCLPCFSAVVLLAVMSGAAAGIELRAGDARLEVEVARTDAERHEGLMKRERLAADTGMLFVFPRSAQYCFWMKDTPLPLSLAFLDRSGIVIQIGEMRPYSEELHCASRPASYAVEMNSGWFVRKGVSVGTGIEGLPRR